MRATACWSPIAVLVILGILPFAAVAAGPPAPEAKAPAAKAPETKSGCEGERSETESLDTMRAGLERGVCSTARVVDRLFGGEHEYSEYEDESNGRASVTLGWNEQDNVEVDLRFRASANPPQINNRFHATIDWGDGHPDRLNWPGPPLSGLELAARFASLRVLGRVRQWGGGTVEPAIDEPVPYVQPDQENKT